MCEHFTYARLSHLNFRYAQLGLLRVTFVLGSGEFGIMVSIVRVVLHQLELGFGCVGFRLNRSSVGIGFRSMSLSCKLDCDCIKYVHQKDIPE